MAKCGEIVVWHWAHRGAESECDPWWRESAWHLAWKSLFPEEQVEVRVERDGVVHRADVMTPLGVIEFQNSPISLQEIRAREEFYGPMYWVFNVQDPYEAQRLLVKRIKADVKSGNDTMRRYWRWKHAQHAPLHVTRRQFWDCGEKVPLFEPTYMYPREQRDDGTMRPPAGVGNVRSVAEAIRIMTKIVPGNECVLPWEPLEDEE